MTISHPQPSVSTILSPFHCQYLFLKKLYSPLISCIQYICMCLTSEQKKVPESMWNRVICRIFDPHLCAGSARGLQPGRPLPPLLPATRPALRPIGPAPDHAHRQEQPQPLPHSPGGFFLPTFYQILHVSDNVT